MVILGERKFDIIEVGWGGGNDNFGPGVVVFRHTLVPVCLI